MSPHSPASPHDRAAPRFGEADLSNCDRELIQHPGSIQPHGALLILDAASPSILQASANVEAMLGFTVDELLGQSIEILGGDLPAQVWTRVLSGVRAAPRAFRGYIERNGVRRGFEAMIHRNADDAVILELEPVNLIDAARLARELPMRLPASVTRLGAAPSLDALASEAVTIYRDITGYDRVMFYRFDPDGHGEVVAEAKESYLEPFVGLHYPESDIPQRARELYLRNRVRVLVDVNYNPVPLLPRLFPPTGEELDMSMSWLRSMSPLHLQYLKNMGVTATLVVSLVREGRLWGLIACHHYSPKRLPYAMRAACDLVAEILSTRIAVLENFSQVRSTALVRRLEARLLEATWTRGEWQRALFEDPRELLRLADATGVALVYEGEILTAGAVPSTDALRDLVDWIATQSSEGGIFTCASLARDIPDFSPLAANACGLLAIELSRPNREYLIWLRGEQVLEVRWAGNPHKPVLPGNDPRDLSPRRSFAVWTERVQGTARRFSPAEINTARAVGTALRDVMLQVRSMSYLITEDRIARLRRSLQASTDGVLIADGAGRIRFVSEAFSRFFRRPHVHLADMEDLPRLFHDQAAARDMVRAVMDEERSWRGELRLDAGAGTVVHLAIRADVIPRLDGAGALGRIVLVTNMSEGREAHAARDRVQRAIHDAQRPLRQGEVPFAESADFHQLLEAVLAHASLAVLEVADDGDSSAVVPTLDDLEASTKRLADLTRQMSAYATNGEIDG
jgi:light-regulated signal transduction histidine kinase (bacteriophytochrome)